MKKTILILFTVMIIFSLTACVFKQETQQSGSGGESILQKLDVGGVFQNKKNDIEAWLVETGTWRDKDNMVVKYVFNADHTGSFINADNVNNRSDTTWSYDKSTKELDIVGALPDERYEVEVTGDGILLKCITSYGFEIELVPGIPVPDTIPEQGTYPEELVGDLIWNVAEEQTGAFREYEDDYWELHADGSGVWYESVFKPTEARWIVDAENRLYIERIYDDGATQVKWFTYEPSDDGFVFTNINTGDSFPIVKRK